MSLDISLNTRSLNPAGSGIFVRENGRTKEISREEWDQKFPNREPVVMYTHQTYTAWHGNITSNVADMAQEADIYAALWMPESCGFKFAAEIIGTLDIAVKMLKEQPQRFDAYNASNGWGTREQFVEFLEEYLQACRTYPTAEIAVDL